MRVTWRLLAVLAEVLLGRSEMENVSIYPQGVVYGEAPPERGAFLCLQYAKVSRGI